MGYDWVANLLKEQPMIVTRRSIQTCLATLMLEVYHSFVANTGSK